MRNRVSNQGCRHTRSVGSEGFTLLETLIAFVILAFSLFALFQAIGQGSRNLAVSSQTEEALNLARSKLAELSTLGQLDTQVREGKFKNGYRWELEFLPQSSEVNGRWIRLKVIWGENTGRARQETLMTFVIENESE